MWCSTKSNETYHRIEYSNDQEQVMFSNSAPSTELLPPNVNRELTLTDEMIQRSREERRYKYSLVSLLVCGLILITTINLGLGSRNCSHVDETSQEAIIEKSCFDPFTRRLFPWQDYRLPKEVTPLQYDLFLHPNLTENKYSGQLNITIMMNRSTHVVILHSYKHNITSVEITDISSEETIPITQISYCKKNNMIALYSPQKLLQQQKYILQFKFVNNLGYTLEGFYLSTYKDSQNVNHIIATTQFEPVAARSTFPCFDEPSFKAVFTLSIVRDANFIALFNTPLKETQNYNDLKIDIFQPTPLMSTYLVAFIISQFHKTTCSTTNGIQINVYSQEEKINDTNYAANFTCKVLQYYENLFQIPYPLKKMDLVAVPDFAAGAMENWGLVTYRETALLYNPKTSSLNDKQWVAKVISHELAHQWFGNLVTMAWWDDLWLNEGFASYMEYKGMNDVETTWSVMKDFISDHTATAMYADSFLNTHQISMKVRNTLEINQLFDSITYDKGACLIRMLVDWVGEKKFFKGITNYLKKYSYKNTKNADLLRSLNQNSQIEEMMISWTSKPGLPVVKVKKSSNNSFSLSQYRFLLSNSKQLSNNSFWYIPISYILNEEPNTIHRTLLTEANMSLNVNSTKNWIKLNHNQAGYYIVDYDEEIWEDLISQMLKDHQIFSTSDRVSLLSDAFTSSRVGSLSYDLLFKFCSYLHNEKDYLPLITATSELAFIEKLLRFHTGFENSDLIRTYIKSFLTPHYEKLAWKDTNLLSLSEVKLQTSMVLNICLYGHQPCLDKSHKLLYSWIVNGTSIPAEWFNLVFYTALKFSSARFWELSWKRWLNETDPNIKSKMLRGLSLTKDGDKIMFLHQQIIDGRNIKSQDHATVLVYTSSTLSGAALTWDFVKSNWEMLIDIYGASSYAMRSIINASLNCLQRDRDLEEARRFFVSKSVDGLKFIKKSLEATSVRINWTSKSAPSVVSWLQRANIHNEL